MSKDKITQYDQNPAANTEVAGVGILGSDPVRNMDNALRAMMGHLADVNKGASPLEDTLVIADADDNSKQFGFDGSGVSPSNKVVLKIPDSSGTIAMQESITPDIDNKIINGDFVIWQRGLSQTTSSYGSDDRWHNGHAGSSKMHSQQTFALGQTDVPGNPKYYSRTVVTSVAGSANYVVKMQAVEGVERLAGKTVTVTFWAKADGSKNITFEFRHRYGTGGTPSPSLNGIGVTTCALTTSWTKFSFTINITSVAGKTLGTDGNDHLLPIFWFDAGSEHNTLTNNLGQQSGTFDIAKVSIVEGDKTVLDDPSTPRHISQELALCQRYYFNGYLPLRGVFSSTSYASRLAAPLPVQMRANPVVTLSGNVFDGIASGNANTITANYSTQSMIELDATCEGVFTVGRPAILYSPSVVTADAELY